MGEQIEFPEPLTSCTCAVCQDLRVSVTFPPEGLPSVRVDGLLSAFVVEGDALAFREKVKLERFGVPRKKCIRNTVDDYFGAEHARRRKATERAQQTRDTAARKRSRK